MPQPRAGGRRARRRRRLISWVLLAVLAVALPINWIVLGTYGPGTLRYAHVAAVGLVLSFIGRRWVAATLPHLHLVRMGLVFAAYTGLVSVVAALNDNSTYAYLQQAAYVAIGLLVALLVADGTLRGEVARIAWWVGPIALASFLWFFSAAMRARGIDPVDTISSAITKGDPQIIQFAFFRSAFTTTVGEQARANLRHEAFAALVAMNWISIWAMTVRRPSAATRRLLLAFVGVSYVMTVLSLSRSILLSLVLAACIPAVRFFYTGRLRSAGALALVGAGVVGLVPLSRLLSQRLLSDTGSYSGREESLRDALLTVLRSPLTGGKTELAAHNFVLDAALSGGLLAGAAAAALMVMAARRWWHLLGPYLRGRSRLAGVGLAAATLPFVRALSAGGGVLSLPECVSLGLFLGIAAAVSTEGQRVRQQARDLAAAPEVPSLGNPRVPALS